MKCQQRRVLEILQCTFKQPADVYRIISLSRFSHVHIYPSVFFFLSLSQDGKTVEDLASDEHIVSLLGKLKKVKVTQLYIYY